jgi:hypothetical protein
MIIRNSADIYEDSGLKPLIIEMMTFPKYFLNKSYGNDEVELFFVINCLKSEAKLRKRFDKRDKVLYWDIILDYEAVKKITAKEKGEILATSIINSFDVLDKYKKLNLNKDAIKEDAKKYFMLLGWLQPNYLSIVHN